jgi:DNA-binding LacI/PurR family transcriptional regulator
MNKSFNTVTEQVAQALRDGVREGRWQDTMPGRNRLAVELGVNHKTVKSALAILEREGLLEARGPGRGRGIVHDSPSPPVSRRFVILVYEKSEFHTDYLMEILQRLQAAGHWAGFATKTLRDLGMNANRVSRYAEKVEADAWVVQAGTRDVLEWFASRPAPAFAIFGRSSMVSLPRSLPSKKDAFRELLDRLVGLGHRRIVMLSREDRRKPTPGGFELEYLARLEFHGIRTGTYNLPDWGNDPDSLSRSLDSLFRHTAPTALIVDDNLIFPAVVQHLARLGLSAPKHVSLACTDSAPEFEWYRPSVTHITWNRGALANHVVSWAKRVRLGKKDRRQNLIRATLVAGGTIGSVPH